MAFSKIAILALAALSAARPLNIPRDLTSIVTEVAWTTVDVPVTLWVDQAGKPIRTDAPAEGGNFAQQTAAHSLESSALPSVYTTTTPVAAAVVPTTTPAPQVQAPSPQPQIITTTTPAPVVAAPTTPQYVAPSPTTTTQAAAPAAPSPANTNSGSSGQAVSASSSGTCTDMNNACEGDITHYDGGLGACGWNVNTNSDMQIALPYGFMGTQSNGNPYCGRALTIQNPTTGATVKATVGDKCMGCEGRSIDLTNVLFDTIGGGCDGRCSGFEWWFDPVQT